MHVQNFSLYTSDGKTKITNVSIGGTNEIKYAARNNHDSFADFIQPEVKVIIRRGQVRRARNKGARKS